MVSIIVLGGYWKSEFINPQVSQLVSLTSADRKFMDELLRPVLSSWMDEDDMTMHQQIDFEGTSVKYDQDTALFNPETGAKKLDHVSEFHLPFIKAWELSHSFTIWASVVDKDALQMINPGHPYHGYSALGEISTHFTAKLSEFSRNISPIQNNLTKAISTASGAVAATVSDAVTIISDPTQQENIQGGRVAEPAKPSSANQLFGNLSSWYTQRRKEWAPLVSTTLNPLSDTQNIENEEEYQLLGTSDNQSPPVASFQSMDALNKPTHHNNDTVSIVAETFPTPPDGDSGLRKDHEHDDKTAAII
ncbi:hypothetical protein BASA83_007611 [Batrachochytrium salamandrivorans]|nr:hypothetical protein BASA83_007611 [Batrachochytrium salamandrivorans]